MEMREVSCCFTYLLFYLWLSLHCQTDGGFSWHKMDLVIILVDSVFFCSLWLYLHIHTLKEETLFLYTFSSI